MQTSLFSSVHKQTRDNQQKISTVPTDKMDSVVRWSKSKNSSFWHTNNILDTINIVQCHFSIHSLWLSTWCNQCSCPFHTEFVYSARNIISLTSLMFVLYVGLVSILFKISNNCERLVLHKTRSQVRFEDCLRSSSERCYGTWRYLPVDFHIWKFYDTGIFRIAESLYHAKFRREMCSKLWYNMKWNFKRVVYLKTNNTESRADKRKRAIKNV